MWKFPGGGATDDDDAVQAAAAAAAAGGGRPVITAQGKCATHPDAEKPSPAAAAAAKSKDGSGPGPAALHTAVMALGWSADASQLATAERGGVSRIWTVGVNKKAEGVYSHPPQFKP